MARHAHGPRRSGSVTSYLRETRVLAAVAVLALLGGIFSDAVATGFWRDHALLAGLAASLIVVMLSVAIVNEVLERRRRRRWSVLAQYVMLELLRNARLIWTGVLELARLLPSDGPVTASLEAGGRIVRDTPRLTAAVRELIGNDDQRQMLHEEIASLASSSEEAIGRWAPVMLNADAYAEVIDRHVELASEVGWIGDLLDHSEPTDERRRRRAHSSAAVQLAGAIEGDGLAERVVVITQYAEQLDRGTLEVALRIVPIEWWEGRLGATVPAEPQTIRSESHS